MCCVPSLRETRVQEIERRQNLKILLHSRSRSVSIRVRKDAVSLFLGLVDDLHCVSDLH